MKKIKQKTLKIIFRSIVISIILSAPIGRVYWLCTDKNYYGFPAVTQCRICNKTVWEWQRYERRQFIIKGCSFCSGSGLVHTKCQGNPVIKIKVEYK
jgi:hypothetical protein